MALDPNIILAGTATTHPTTPIPLLTQVGQAAQAQETGVATQKTAEDVQAEQLQNQIAQRNLQNGQIYARSMQNVLSGLKTQQTAPNADGTQNVLQPGVDPTWKVDKATDWYVDADGNPVSHAAGPAFSPSGRPNLYSNDVLSAVANEAAKNGATPDFVMGQLQSGMKNASDFDKTNVDLYKLRNETATAQSTIAKNNADMQKTILETMGNRADDLMVRSSAVPGSFGSNALLEVNQKPNFWAPRLQAAGVQVQKDPQTGMLNFDPNDPKVQALFNSTASNSPNALARQESIAKAAQEQAEAASTRATTTKTNIQNAEDSAHNFIAAHVNADGSPTSTASADYQNWVKQNPAAATLLGLTGNLAADQPKLVGAASGSEAAGRSATTLASKQTTNLTAADKVKAAQEDVQSTTINLQRNQAAQALLTQLINSGVKGGKVYNSISEINEAMGNDPEYAELKSYIAQGNMKSIMGLMNGSGRLGPVIEQYASQLENGTMPLRTIQTLMSQDAEQQKSDLAIKSQYASNLQKQLSTTSPGTNAAPAPKPNVRGSANPAPGASGSPSPVGTVKAGRGGVQYVKIKAGADNDQTAWMRVQ